jgi:hypothetical protein
MLASVTPRSVAPELEGPSLQEIFLSPQCRAVLVEGSVSSKLFRFSSDILEQSIIWSIIENPETDLQRVLLRQSIIGKLIELAEIKSIYVDLGELNAQIMQLMASNEAKSKQLDDDDFGPDQLLGRDQSQRIKATISKLQGSISTALNRLINTEVLPLASCATSLVSAIELLCQELQKGHNSPTISFEKSEGTESESLSELSSSLFLELLSLTAIIAAALTIKRLGFAKVDFIPEGEEYYANAYNLASESHYSHGMIPPSFVSGGQATRKSAQDGNIILVVSNNEPETSFWLTGERLLRQCAQAFGYTYASEARLKLRPGFLQLVPTRSTVGGSLKNDVDSVTRIFQTGIPHGSVCYIDGFFNNTDPIDQAKLTIALGRALSERMCTVRIGSKNNSALTGHAQQEGIASYHLNEGLANLNLTTGIAAVNTGSEDLSEGSESTISDKSPDRDLRTAPYSDTERKELKNQATPLRQLLGGGDYLEPVSAPWFGPFAWHFGQFNPAKLSDRNTFTDIDKHGARFHDFTSDRLFSGYAFINPVVESLLFRGWIPEIPEILERGRFFEGVGERSFAAEFNLKFDRLDLALVGHQGVLELQGQPNLQALLAGVVGCLRSENGIYGWGKADIGILKLTCRILAAPGCSEDLWGKIDRNLQQLSRLADDPDSEYSDEADKVRIYQAELAENLLQFSSNSEISLIDMSQEVLQNVLNIASLSVPTIRDASLTLRDSLEVPLVALNYLNDETRCYQDFLGLLRGVDSVHCHQFANYLQRFFESYFNNMQSGSEVLAMLRSGDSLPLLNGEGSLSIVKLQCLALRLELLKLKDIISFAGELRTLGFVRGQIADCELNIKGVWNLNQGRDKQVTNDIRQLLWGHTEIACSPNGSGKSFTSLGAVLQHILIFHSTGLAAHADCQIPVCSKIFMIGKEPPARHPQVYTPSAEQSAQLSGLDGALKAASEKERVLILVDEPKVEYLESAIRIITRSNGGLICAVHGLDAVTRLLSQFSNVSAHHYPCEPKIPLIYN